MTSSRYIRARVVDFSQPNFAGERDDVAGRKKKGPRGKIGAKLRVAKAIRRRIKRLREKQPPRWERRVHVLTGRLRAVMSDLKRLGWTAPKKARKPSAAPTDELLDELPEDTPEEMAELDQPLDDEGLDEIPDVETGNWLDGYVGAEPARQKRNLFLEAGKLLASAWSKPVPLGEGGRIQTKPGQRAMVTTISPGLYIVQLVSDAAAKKVAGDNVGILPLVLYPLVKNRILQKLAPPPDPAPAAAPAPAQQAPVAPVGCDDCRRGR
ncbi:MAG: hypothetical protein V4850_36765 [Myxococcota bacterium]